MRSKKDLNYYFLKNTIDLDFPVHPLKIIVVSSEVALICMCFLLPMIHSNLCGNDDCEVILVVAPKAVLSIVDSSRQVFVSSDFIRKFKRMDWLSRLWSRHHSSSRPQKRRRHIDRTTIGLPTDFRHTGHIGSGEMSSSSNHLNTLQTQMSSKGGYEYNMPVSVEIRTVEIAVGGGGTN